MTWPDAFCFVGLALAVAWPFVVMFRAIEKLSNARSDTLNDFLTYRATTTERKPRKRSKS